MPEANIILCARCKVPIKGSGDPETDAIVTCPICGETDSLENALREASEYMADKVVHGSLDAMFAGLKGSPNIKVTTNPLPERGYRFIFDNESH